MSCLTTLRGLLPRLVFSFFPPPMEQVMAIALFSRLKTKAYDALINVREKVVLLASTEADWYTHIDFIERGLMAGMDINHQRALALEPLLVARR